MSDHTRTKVRNFFKKYGFYFALVACIAAVGTAALLALQSDVSEHQGVDVQNQEAPNLEETLKSTPTPLPTVTSTVTPSPTPTVSPTPSPSPTPTATPKPATQSELTLTMPLEGEIIRAFSGDELVHNSTLNMWMTHNGIDIAADQGSTVMAALSGTVQDAYYDETRGNVVVIAHSSDRVTLYAGLSEITCNKDDKINAGDEVGKSGTPAFESNDGPHLHFEFSENGEFIDPVTYFR